MLNNNNAISPNDVLANLSDDGRKFLLKKFIPAVEAIDEGLSEGELIEGCDDDGLAMYLIYLLSEVQQFSEAERAYSVRLYKMCRQFPGVRQDDIFEIAGKLSLITSIIDSDEAFFWLNDDRKVNLTRLVLHELKNLFGYNGVSLPDVGNITSDLLDNYDVKYSEVLNLVYEFSVALGDFRKRSSYDRVGMLK